MTPTGSRSLFEHLVLDNLGLKIISLVCSIGYFAFIHGAERAQRIVDVPVIALMPNAGANRQLIRSLPTEVTITLSGSKTQIDDLNPRDLGTVELDLTTGRESDVVLRSDMFQVPPGLDVEQIYPTRIEIKWDDVVSVQLPIQVARTGDPIDGFTVRGSIRTQPETITARGPRSVIDVIQFARATPYDVTGLTEGEHPRNLQLDFPPPLVTYDTDSVNARVEIVREERVVPFQGVKIEIVGAPKAVAKPGTVSVTIRGTPEEVNAIQPDSIVPRVEIPDTINLKEPGSQLLPVIVDLAGVTVEVEPPKVLVKW